MKDLRLLSYNPSLEQTIFSLNLDHLEISGKELLLSKITKLLLLEKGSNIFNPQSGNPFYDLLTSTAHSAGDDLNLVIPIFLQEITKQIKLEQSAQSDLQKSEKLVNLELIGVVFDSLFLGYNIILNVITEDNAETTLRI